MAGSVVVANVEHHTRGVVKMKAVITCDASGVATATVMGQAFGRIVAIGYVPGTFATGVDIIIKDQMSGIALVTLTDAGLSARYFRPTINITGNTGAAVAAATTAVDVNRDIVIGGKITVEAAQGGNLGAGEIHVVVDESFVGNPALTN